MKQNNTDITVKDLIKKYTDAICARQAHVDFYQKQIETERATISSFKEKINVLTDTLTDLGLNKEPNKFKPASNITNRGEEKWEGLFKLAPDCIKPLSVEDLKYNDLTSKGQYNKTTSPIAPLTTEQINSLSALNKQNLSRLEEALEALNKQMKKDDQTVRMYTGVWPYYL